MRSQDGSLKVLQEKIQKMHFFVFPQLLQRVGDRPTATILQVQFHFFDFCMVFKGRIFDQNMPLLEGPIIL